MVQMKAPYQSSAQMAETLYIPHGSDERLVEVTKMIYLYYFISHMVQMKGWFD